MHTRGDFRGKVSELVSSVREVFQKIIPALLDNGIVLINNY
jgi:hypothetical protein